MVIDCICLRIRWTVGHAATLFNSPLIFRRSAVSSLRHDRMVFSDIEKGLRRPVAFCLIRQILEFEMLKHVLGSIAQGLEKQLSLFWHVGHGAGLGIGLVVDESAHYCIVLLVQRQRLET